jgi:hypothetical protein
MLRVFRSRPVHNLIAEMTHAELARLSSMR